MKILANGKYFKNNTHKCKECGCVFRYAPKDLTRLKYKDESIRILVICPECKEKNYLD